MRTNEIHKINCFVNLYFSNAEHVKFLEKERERERNVCINTSLLYDNHKMSPCHVRQQYQTEEFMHDLWL